MKIPIEEEGVCEQDQKARATHRNRPLFFSIRFGVHCHTNVIAILAEIGIVDFVATMDSLLKLASDNSGVLLVVLLLAVLVLAIMLALQVRANRAMQRRWLPFVAGAQGQDLQTLLLRHLDERRAQGESLDDTRTRLVALEQKMDSAKRFVGMVRYDAFEDVGGNQSFSMAILDDKGDGALVTCLYGRQDCRVYAKQLDGGESDRSITNEERRAIEQATAGMRTVRAR